MNFTIEQDERGTIFRPKEARLDSLVASELKAEFLILAQPDVEKLIIDLSDVEYIDSAGLSALLLARRQMSSHEGDVRLVGARPEVRSLLSLTQLDRVFGIYETITEALNAPQLSSTIVSPYGLATVGRTIDASTLAGIMMADGGEDDLIEDDDDDLDDIDDDDYEYDKEGEEGEDKEKKEDDVVEEEKEEDDDDDDLAYEEDDDLLEEPFDDDYDEDEDEDEEDEALVV